MLHIPYIPRITLKKYAFKGDFSEMTMTQDTKIKQKWWQTLANPGRFMKISRAVLPWLIFITFILFIIGLFFCFTAPLDYQHGVTTRIMYLHVPYAWIAMLCYTLMTLSALGTLLWRHPLADIALKSAAPIGAVFTFLALITGSLWGRPAWGTWWMWDARLVTMLILLFIYLCIIMMCHLFDSFGKSMRAAAIFTLLGFVNIPIIKFSVYWWHSLHQTSSVIRKGGSGIDPSMLIPLFTMAAAFTFLFVTLHLLSMRNEITRQKVQNLEKQAARLLRSKDDLS